MMREIILLFVFSLLVLPHADIQIIKSTTDTADIPIFVEVTDEVGLSGVSGQFLAWGDYNNDGYQDLLVNGKRLFRNMGPPDWKFVEVTEEAGIGGTKVNCGVWGDYDNDGNLDFYAPAGEWSSDRITVWDILWHNNGDGTFTNVTKIAGDVYDMYPSVAAAWGDYDRDGYLDLYVANYENSSMAGYPDTLWHNNGDGTFTNVTKEAHIDDYSDPKPGRGVAWCDYNNDGYVDIYVSNYRLRPNYLWENQRDGTFRNVSFEKNVQGEENRRLGWYYYGHSVGAAWADYDNDGDFDVWVTNLAHKDPYRGPLCDDSELLMNLGEGENYTFINVRDESGIPIKRIMGGEDELHVGIAWGDFNNDGYIDFFVPQIYELDYAYSYLFLNNGNGTFTDVSEEAGVRVWNTYAGCWCDYDNDGDLDLITAGKIDTQEDTPNVLHLFQNQGNSNAFLNINLIGMKSNTFAIGARVIVEWDGKMQMREVEGGMGSHGMQNSLPVEFGFGGYTGKVKITVRWPSGYYQVMDNVELNQFIEIVEMSNLEPNIEILSLRAKPDTVFEYDEVEIICKVRNSGYGKCAESIVSLKINESGEVITRKKIRDLETFESAEIVGYYKFEKTGKYEIIAEVERCEPPENIFNDNIEKIYITVFNESISRPIAHLKAFPTKVYTGEDVKFDGTASKDDKNITLYFFDFGDNESSGWTIRPIVHHSYDRPGKYTAMLIVKDNEGLESTNEASVIIEVIEKPNLPPRAEIVYIEPTESIVGEEVKFCGKGYDEDGEIVRYRWYSSIDGFMSNEPTFSTKSLSIGMHEIHFSVMDDNGTWSENVTEVIKVSELQNIPPRANILFILPKSAYYDTPIHFKGEGMDEDGEVVSYYWESSIDGYLSNEKEFYTSSLSPGTHKIKFKVMDDSGAWSKEDTETILIYEKVEENLPPIAEISVMPENGTISTIFHFSAENSSDPDGKISEYFFDFGDGTNSGWISNMNITHTYEFNGEYFARVRVKDDDGYVSRWSKDVMVSVSGEKIQKKVEKVPISTLEYLLTFLAVIVLIKRRENI